MYTIPEIDMSKLPDGTTARYGRVHDGEDVLVKFPNGYRASIIHTSGSYGVEVAVLNLQSEFVDFPFHPRFSTMDHVFPYLDFEEEEGMLMDVLVTIGKLPETY